jgi:hypothetical protein
MKYLKNIVIFLVFVLVVIALLSIILPTNQKVKRSITINASPVEVFEQIALLRNFNSWSVWATIDSTVIYNYAGTDGTVGASASWKGHPALSGEGEMRIIAIKPGEQVEHEFKFISPRDGKAHSILKASQQGSQTVVNWEFSMSTPRPWNVFNLIYSMDRQMGKDFEDGLKKLKAIAEKSQ